jgi:subtilisin family serine protease
MKMVGHKLDQFSPQSQCRTVAAFCNVSIRDSKLTLSVFPSRISRGSTNMGLLTEAAGGLEFEHGEGTSISFSSSPSRNIERPAMLLISLCAAFPLSTPTVLFQDGESQTDVVRTKTPIEVVVGPVQDEELETKEDTRAPITASQASIMGRQDDEVPLPIPAVFAESEEGDVVVQPASGDPFFLGFTAGRHYPPANELIDPLILDRYQSGSDSRPGEFTYAFVMFSKRMTEARIGRLEALGCRVLEFHPHYTVKVALPLTVLTDVSVLPFVRWVGQAQNRQKYDPHLVLEMGQSTESRLHVIVDLFESDLNADSIGTPVGYLTGVKTGMAPFSLEGQIADEDRPQIWMSNGWMQRRLEGLGLEVQWYNRSAMSIQGWIERDILSLLVDLDFVQGLETVPAIETFTAPHDESMPMITADRIRSSFGGDTNTVAMVGIQDSGVESDHRDLNGSSLPFLGGGWDCTPAGDPWSDDDGPTDTGHGTHVAGTLLGRGVQDDDLTGSAPGLASWGETSALYNLRIFADAGSCSWSNQTCISVFNSPITWSSGKVAPIPHLIQNSWGTIAVGWSGTESIARTYDAAVYDDDQLWVFAAGNSGAGGANTVGNPGAAKNILTVGSVVDYINGSVGDPGNRWTGSGQGPIGDGRWKPNIVAPGRYVESLLANNNTGYVHYNGTSMATPHVSGVAATLVDHYSWLRYDPALMSALLMATAITKNDQVLTSPGSTHHNTYGAGRVSAEKAHYITSGYDYLAKSTFEQKWDEYHFVDFTVPSGTDRLVVVMHYVEDQCSALASQALVNDYDLWLDRAPVDTANGNTGEYWSQQSTVDNTEIRILDNPASGAWRWKTYPDSVAASSQKVKMAVVVYAVFDDTTPNATLTLSVDDNTVRPGDTVSVSANVNPTDYIASAVILDRSGSSATVVSASTTLYDGIVTDLSGTRPDGTVIGSDILLGDILDTISRTGTWGLSYSSEGTKSVTVNARSDNMVDKTATINVIVDGTEPGAVSALASSSHTAGVWSNNPNITWTWNAATDALSGLQGYGIYETTSCSIPGKILDIGAVTTHTGGPYSSSLSGRAFNIRSVDNCDNWDADYVCDSNYLIDVDAPTAPTFNSSDHAVGGKSCNSTITVNWNAGTDGHSGVEGYGIVWGSSPKDCRANILDTTGTSETATLSPGTWYLNVITKDFAGNWTNCGNLASFGPFTIVPSCTLFADDFESGSYAAGGWTISGPGRCKVSAKAAFTGAFGARLKKGGQGTGACTVGVAAKQTWIQAPPVDTTGWSGVRVDMNAHFRKNTLSCEYMDLQWWDGAAWQSAGIVETHAWAPYSFNLPNAALGNPALSLRLITNSKGKGEKAELDDFAVIGIE